MAETFRSGKENPDAVLIDDNALVHLAWEMEARKRGKTVKVFSSPKEFLASKDSIDASTPIYLDQNFGEGAPTGQEAAEVLHAVGFEQIYLATGEDPSSLKPSRHIRAVVGKKPPWKRE